MGRVPTETEGSDPVRAAQAGDRRALETLLNRLLPRVRNLVRYLVRNDEDTDDMAQVALIQIAKGIGTFRGDGSLEAWADRITVRETLRYKRNRTRRMQERTRNRHELAAGAAAAPSPQSYLRRRDAIRLLDSLPDIHREVLVLHHVVGHTVPEIASTLNIPLETVRSRLRLGVRKLRSQLQTQGELP